MRYRHKGSWVKVSLEQKVPCPVLEAIPTFSFLLQPSSYMTLPGKWPKMQWVGPDLVASVAAWALPSNPYTDASSSAQEYYEVALAVLSSQSAPVHGISALTEGHLTEVSSCAPLPQEDTARGHHL